MEKLLSMTDFVLEQRMSTDEINKSSFHRIHAHINNYYDKVYAYAKFLKQPLTLEIFVPVDSEGNVLEEPRMIVRTIGFDEQDVLWDVDEVESYRAAKEKVLFEGWKIYNAEWHKQNETIHNDDAGIIIYLKSGTISIQQPNGISYGIVKTIEDLCQYDLVLAPSHSQQF